MWLPQLKMKDPNFSALRTDTLIPKTLLSKLPSISSLKPWGKVSEIRRRHVSSPLILSRSQGWRRIEKDAGRAGGGGQQRSHRLSSACTASWLADFLTSSFHVCWHFFFPPRLSFIGQLIRQWSQSSSTGKCRHVCKGPFRTGSLKRK